MACYTHSIRSNGKLKCQVEQAMNCRRPIVDHFHRLHTSFRLFASIQLHSPFWPMQPTSMKLTVGFVIWREEGESALIRVFNIHPTVSAA